jgi:hypothetical protein
MSIEHSSMPTQHDHSSTQSTTHESADSGHASDIGLNDVETPIQMPPAQADHLHQLHQSQQHMTIRRMQQTHGNQYVQRQIQRSEHVQRQKPDSWWDRLAKGYIKDLSSPEKSQSSPPKTSQATPLRRPQPKAIALTDPPYKLVPPTERAAKGTRGVSSAIQQDLQNAINKVKQLSGVDLGVEFGDTSRDLAGTTTKKGADNISWHKTGRAVDIPQSKFNNGVIAKDESGDEMFFRIYLPYTNATAKESELPKNEKGYLKRWPTIDKGAFSRLLPQPNKWYVDVTAIFTEFGFTRIAAHTGWEKTQSKMEWWHYEKRDQLSMYQALRQIYTEDQIVQGYSGIYKSNPGKYHQRLLREGFPETVLGKLK